MRSATWRPARARGALKRGHSDEDKTMRYTNDNDEIRDMMQEDLKRETREVGARLRRLEHEKRRRRAIERLEMAEIFMGELKALLEAIGPDDEDDFGAGILSAIDDDGRVTDHILAAGRHLGFRLLDEGRGHLAELAPTITTLRRLKRLLARVYGDELELAKFLSLHGHRDDEGRFVVSYSGTSHTKKGEEETSEPIIERFVLTEKILRHLDLEITAAIVPPPA